MENSAGKSEDNEEEDLSTGGRKRSAERTKFSRRKTQEGGGKQIFPSIGGEDTRLDGAQSGKGGAGDSKSRNNRRKVETDRARGFYWGQKVPLGQRWSACLIRRGEKDALLKGLPETRRKPPPEVLRRSQRLCKVGGSQEREQRKQKEPKTWQ